MPAPLQRLSPMNTRLSSLEVAVDIPRHQGRRITSSTTASAGTWPANETPDEKERNPGVYGTRHGNLSFGGVRRLTSDHGLLPPATTLVRFDERERCIFEGWRSRAGRRSRAGPSGRRRSIRSRLAGPSSLFPCFPPSLARSRVGGSSFHIGHMGSCGSSWEPVSVCWGDTGLRFARPRGWTSADAVLGEYGSIEVFRTSPLPPSPAHHLCRPS